MPVLLITLLVRDAIPRIYLAFNQYGAGHYDAVIVSRDSPCEIEKCSVSRSLVVSHSASANRKCFMWRKLEARYLPKPSFKALFVKIYSLL